MPLVLGARDTTGDNRFSRIYLDDVRVYDRMMTLQEITDIVGPQVITMTPGRAFMNVGDPDFAAVQINVPASLVATSAVSVTITSGNPAVAKPAGAAGASLTVTFPLGSPYTITNIALHAAGLARPR